MTNAKSEDERHRDTFAIVGELVMTATGIDWQLNRVLVEVLDIGGTPMVESVVATIDTRLKIEILKERAKHITAKDWKNGVTKYCDKIEKVGTLSATPLRFSKMGVGLSNQLRLQNC
jgi:hypothetical protein